jgi:hypothetical protein
MMRNNGKAAVLMLATCLTLFFTRASFAAHTVWEWPLTCPLKPPAGVSSKFYKWPVSELDAYHGQPEIYYKKAMHYCLGDTSETKDIFYVWPSWRLRTREDWFYPLQFVDTAGGVLATRGSEPMQQIFLDGKVFIDSLDGAVLGKVYKEGTGKPEIVLVVAAPLLYTPLSAPQGLFFIDLGIKPPFISPAMEFYEPDPNYFAGFPSSADVVIIERAGKDMFTFSVRQDPKAPSPLPFSYHYDRKTRTVTKIARAPTGK